MKLQVRGAIVLVLFVLVSGAWPVPVHAGHAQLAGPGAGTTLHGVTWSGYGNLSFVGIEERLVAHHEWRDVVLSTVEYPWSQGPQPFGPAFDLETGLFVGRTFDYTVDIPIYGEALGELGLVHRFEGRHLGGLLGMDSLLPESLLWGRYLSPGDSWAVSAAPWATGPRAVEVRVEAGATDAARVVHVSERTVRDGVTSELLWRLGIEAGDTVVASERFLAYRPDVSVPGEVEFHELPLVVTEEAERPFAWWGASHVALTNGPDRLMTYGRIRSLPDDPDPHPLFDVQEAAAAALASDHEAVRAFHAKAVDPYLVHASLSGVDAPDPSVRWQLEFMERGGNHLSVRLHGWKTPWAPLVVTETEGELHAGSKRYLDAAARDATVTVHPGSYARYFDGFASERDRLVTGYQWSLESFSSGGFATAGGESARVQDLFVHECPFQVTVAGAIGVVISSGTHGSSRLPSASCDHALWYEELDPVADRL